jgi:hypothetical protein
MILYLMKLSSPQHRVFYFACSIVQTNYERAYLPIYLPLGMGGRYEPTYRNYTVLW